MASKLLFLFICLQLSALLVLSQENSTKTVTDTFESHDNIEIINRGLDSLIKDFINYLEFSSLKRGNYITVDIHATPNKKDTIHLGNFIPGICNGVLGELNIQRFIVYFTSESYFFYFIKIKGSYNCDLKRLTSIREKPLDPPFEMTYYYENNKFERYRWP